MKRLLVIIMMSAGLLSPVALTAGHSAAVDIFNNCGSGSATTKPDVCKDTGTQGTSTNPVISIIKAAINVISFIVGLGAVIGIVVSGVRIITAGGDSQAVASARTALIYSLAGAAVVVLAQAIVALVLDKVK